MAVAMAHVRRVTFAAAVMGTGYATAFRVANSIVPRLYTGSHIDHGVRRSLTWGHCCRGQWHEYGSETTGVPNLRPRSFWRPTALAMSTVDQRGREASRTDSPSTSTYDISGDGYGDEGGDDANDPVDNPGASSLLRELRLAIQSALKRLSKKTASLQRELSKAEFLEETTKRANLIVSNLYRLPPGTSSAEVEDWEDGGKIVELVLNTKEYASAQEEADALFASARKIKRGSKVVEELMQKSLEGEEILKKALLDLESMANDDDAHVDEGALILIQERLELTSKLTGFQSPDFDDANRKIEQPRVNKSKKRSSEKNNNKPNPRELTSPSGHRVLVGRNRRDNEAICFQLSKPTDVWMHSRGCPGAHVLLCVRRGSPEVTDADLQFAADLAAFYSDARTEARAEVTTAESKHITKPRGAPLGAVALRREGRTLLGRPGDVADDLKEARESSGAAWDEGGYRKLGTRARNKKKTVANDKAEQRKGREEARRKNKRIKRKEEQDWY